MSELMPTLDVRGARTWRPAQSPALAASITDPGTAHHQAVRAASRRTGQLLPALERALRRRDAEAISDSVASLIGRGPGLTPSGDDALVGLLAVLHRLAAGSPGQVEAPTAAATGATSGADALLGVMSGVRLVVAATRVGAVAA